MQWKHAINFINSSLFFIKHRHIPHIGWTVTPTISEKAIVSRYDCREFLNKALSTWRLGLQNSANGDYSRRNRRLHSPVWTGLKARYTGLVSLIDGAAQRVQQGSVCMPWTALNFYPLSSSWLASLCRGSLNIGGIKRGHYHPSYIDGIVLLDTKCEHRST